MNFPFFKLLLHRDLQTTPHAAAHIHGREKGRPGRKKMRKRDGGREGVSPVARDLKKGKFKGERGTKFYTMKGREREREK